MVGLGILIECLIATNHVLVLFTQGGAALTLGYKYYAALQLGIKDGIDSLFDSPSIAEAKILKLFVVRNLSCRAA